jgi:hypothetical protein
MRGLSPERVIATVVDLLKNPEQRTSTTDFQIQNPTI